MKIQDLIFFAALVILIALRRPKFLLIAGLASWTLAIPLFAKWVFFTAERLTWYGAGFVLVFILISLVRPNTVK